MDEVPKGMAQTGDHWKQDERNMEEMKMNQTDAISRSAALETINEVDISDCTDIDSIIDRIYAEVASVPALDVAPVVHARWIPITLYGKEHAIKCSACNNCDNPSKVPGRYCWQCGAKMDAEEDPDVG